MCVMLKLYGLMFSCRPFSYQRHLTSGMGGLYCQCREVTWMTVQNVHGHRIFLYDVSAVFVHLFVSFVPV
jgi:hypothetical protein